jgi:diaminohydroxyphosphoribosylaminopyrimidine deaminase/5-amino-6-(5-phosphoribosylamino)uracil reductase
METNDRYWMQQAIALAKEGQGMCAPNPNVGCVIVKDGQQVAAARTANGGRPHAELQALRQAGPKAKGATLYVTLEPCAHHGQTPPCSQAIIEVDIGRVVIACRDPFEAVNGAGIRQLQKAGIQVVIGVEEAAGQEVNRGFFSRLRHNRPWVMLKTATSKDGFIAKPDGSSKWITGEEARENGHYLRARNDAILTGSGTYLFDQPQLTVRIPGLEDHSPRRYVLDRSGKIQHSDFTILRQPSLPLLMNHMAEEGINYLMVEAGAELSRAFLEAGLIDELYWYRAPHDLGEGIRAFQGQWEAYANQAKIMEELSLGNDRLTVYRFFRIIIE